MPLVGQCSAGTAFAVSLEPTSPGRHSIMSMALPSDMAADRAYGSSMLTE